MAFIKKCPECGSIHLTYDSHLGEIICNDCGLVVEEKMVDTGIDLSGKFDKSEKKWQERVSTSIERNLRLAMAELRVTASYLNLPNVVKDEAARIYNYVLKRGLVRGRSMESVIAACLYAACRSYNIPRTLDEMA